MPELVRRMDRPGGASHSRAQFAHIAAAKALCADCPVRWECREWALEDPDPVPVMIAGGLTPNERSEMRRSTLRQC